MNTATNLTLEEINSLLDRTGKNIVAEAATYVQVNASNQAQYEITYSGGLTDHIFVVQDAEGTPLVAEVNLKAEGE